MRCHIRSLKKIFNGLWAPLEIVFQKQSYSSLHSGQSLAWDNFRCVIANPCSDCAIGYSAGTDAERCVTH